MPSCDCELTCGITDGKLTMRYVFCLQHTAIMRGIQKPAKDGFAPLRLQVPEFGYCESRVDEAGSFCQARGGVVDIQWEDESGPRRRISYICPDHARKIVETTEMPKPGDSFTVEEL